jgi:stage III sporulation protein AG
MEKIFKFLREKSASDKKFIYYPIALTALGAMALALSGCPDSSRTVAPPPQAWEETIEIQSPQSSFYQERALELRLEEIFSLVEGAGQVRVMISPFGGRETIFAVDTVQTQSHSTEEDSHGGSREQRQYSSQEQTVIISDRQGTDRPLVLREIEPSTGGIIIIAQGGNNAQVRADLTRAAQAVLGLDAHMIQVLAMALEG